MSRRHADHVVPEPAATGASFTVYVEGDIGDAVSHPRVAAVQSSIADGRPDLVHVVGDLTYAHAHGRFAVDQHFNDVRVRSPRTLAFESGQPNPDAHGRILLRPDLGSPSPGRHTYLLGRSPDVAPGFHWLRPTRARPTQVAKIAFLR